MTGKPFNIASDALPTQTLAPQCDPELGDFVWKSHPAIKAPVAV